jgi:hypothetical protein
MSGHSEDAPVAACRGVYGHEARATHRQRREIPRSFLPTLARSCRTGGSNVGSPQLTMGQEIMTRFDPGGATVDALAAYAFNRTSS